MVWLAHVLLLLMSCFYLLLYQSRFDVYWRQNLDQLSDWSLLALCTLQA